jgi:hypothetical protein
LLTSQLPGSGIESPGSLEFNSRTEIDWFSSTSPLANEVVGVVRPVVTIEENTIKMIIPIKTPRVTNQGPKYILASLKLKLTDTKIFFHVLRVFHYQQI